MVEFVMNTDRKSASFLLAKDLVIFAAIIVSCLWSLDRIVNGNIVLGAIVMAGWVILISCLDRLSK